MEIYNTNEVTTSNTKWTSLDTNNYNHYELEYSNGILKYTVTTQSGASKTIQLTERMSWIGKALGLFVETNNGINCWIKNIKVESL